MGVLQPGKELGRYHIDAHLASGGMADAWLATAKGVGGFRKRVVLKTIREHVAEDEEFVRMFIQEASLAAEMNHPNIIHVFDLGETEGVYFIAMEHVPGRSLRQVLKRLHKNGESCPTWFIVRTVAECCKALTHLHTFRDDEGNVAGVVHRDVSPENILVSFTGAVKLLDFGVATRASSGHDAKLKGKAHYSSAEQIRGYIHPQNDVYALGVVLYEFLANHRPYSKELNPAALMQKIVAGPPPSPLGAVAPHVPAQLQRIVGKAMAFDAAQRYRTAAALRVELEQYLSLAGEQARGREAVGKFVCSLFRGAKDMPGSLRGATGGGAGGDSDLIRLDYGETVADTVEEEGIPLSIEVLLSEDDEPAVDESLASPGEVDGMVAAAAESMLAPPMPEPEPELKPEPAPKLEPKPELKPMPESKPVSMPKPASAARPTLFDEHVSEPSSFEESSLSSANAFVLSEPKSEAEIYTAATAFETGSREREADIFTSYGSSPRVPLTPERSPEADDRESAVLPSPRWREEAQTDPFARAQEEREVEHAGRTSWPGWASERSSDELHRPPGRRASLGWLGSDDSDDENKKERSK